MRDAGGDISLASGAGIGDRFPVKSFSGLLVFAVAFLLGGVAVHYGFYRAPGLFVWSLSDDPESGRSVLSRTRFDLVPTAYAAGGDSPASAKAPPAAEADPAEAAANETADAEGAEAAEVAEAAEADGEPGEIELFNGVDLDGWESTRFGGEGEVFVNEDGYLEFGFGAVITGVHWTGEPPATSNYEIELEAMKLDGNDFFCALTFPVGDSHGTFVLGGWGGGVVGISCVDDLNASENETMSIEGFERDRWFLVRVRVTDERLEAWIDDRKMVDLPLEGRKISLLPGDIELSKPIGIAAYQTRAQYRNLLWRCLEGED